MGWAWIPEGAEERKGKGPKGISWKPAMQYRVRTQLGAVRWNGQQAPAGKGATMKKVDELSPDKRKLADIRKCIQILEKGGPSSLATQGLRVEEQQLVEKLFRAQPPSERLKDLEVRLERDDREVQKLRVTHEKAEERAKRAVEAVGQAHLAMERAAVRATESRQKLDELKLAIGNGNRDRLQGRPERLECTQQSLAQALRVIQEASQNTGVTGDKSVETLVAALNFQLETPRAGEDRMGRADSGSTTSTSGGSSKRQRVHTVGHETTGGTHGPPA